MTAGGSRAVLLEEGSLTSHMTIVARAIGVPVIGRLHDIRHSVEDGEPILVDGDNGSVIIRPTGSFCPASSIAWR